MNGKNAGGGVEKQNCDCYKRENMERMDVRG